MKRKSLAFIGWRFIFGRRGHHVPDDLARKAVRGAILSVAISLVPLLIVMQVSDGMIEGITARYIELSTYHLQVRSYSPAGLDENLRQSILATPAVTGAWFEQRSAGVVFHQGHQEGVSIRALQPAFLADEATRQYMNLLAGELSLDKPVDALIGSALAENLGVGPGDAINLITMRTNQAGALLPRVSIFIIKGVVSAGYREIDAHWLLIPYQSAGRVMEADSSEKIIGVKIADPYTGSALARERLHTRLAGSAQVHAWPEIERNLFASLANTRSILLLIMAITVIVAAVNVTSALSTLAMERSREIAVLKCLGAKNIDIAMIFSLSGAFLGALGALLGCMAGILCGMQVNGLIYGIERVINASRRLFAGQAAASAIRLLEPAYYLEKIPVGFDFRNIVTIVLLTIIVSFLAALFPARKAAKLIPLEVMRKHG